MRVALMLSIFCSILICVPASFAQTDTDQKTTDEEQKKTTDSSSKTEEKQETKKDALSDPWTAPKIPEEQTQAESKAEIVTPDHYPESEIDRPLVLLPMVLEPRLDMILDFISLKGIDNQFLTRMGAGFGIIDNLEAGLSIPMMFTPKVRVGDLNMYGMYDLTSLLGDVVNLAGRLNFVIPLSDTASYWPNADFALLVDAPAKYKIIDMLAAIADLGMGFALYPGDDAFLFFLDAGVLFQALGPLSAQWTIGVHMFAGQNTTTVPMHLRIQYTLIGDLDLWTDMSFLDLNNKGADWFQLLFGAAFRIGF